MAFEVDKFDEERAHWRDELESEVRYWANRESYWSGRYRGFELEHRKKLGRIDYSDDVRDQDYADLERLRRAADFCAMCVESREIDLASVDDPEPTYAAPWPTDAGKFQYGAAVAAAPTLGETVRGLFKKLRRK
jgi:hypothetical protein